MPKKELISLCEDLLGRARSGALEGLLVVEFREGDRVNCQYKFDKPDDTFKAATFASAVLWQDELLAETNTTQSEHE